MKHWLAAFRLKTLPLALGAIILGSKLHTLAFDFQIFLFASLTAIFLQVLSNLANDYGDFVKGTDKHRKDRQLAGGTITPLAMKAAIVVFAVLALFSGIFLLYISFGTAWRYYLWFLGLGLVSIAAAITYTVGKKAYGYNGLGDISVFVFFGLVGVVGCSFLYRQEIDSAFWMPAIAYGCLSEGALNVNNIRDLDKDILTNKMTLASKFGKSGAFTYQFVLMLLALAGFLCYQLATGYISLAPLGVAILGYVHLRKLQKAETTDDFNQQLKFLSLGSLGVVILFAIKLFM